MINIKDINVEKLTLTDGRLQYDGKPFSLISDYYPAYIRKFKDDVFLSIRISPSDPLHIILCHVDELMEKQCPSNLQHSKLVKTFTDRNGIQHICTSPKIVKTHLFNEEKQPITFQDIVKMGKIHCRFIGKFSHVFNSKKYWSISLYGNQLMVKQSPNTIVDCMFD